MADASRVRTIGPSGYFVLSFGTIVGSGWVLVMGDWLTAAGPVGTVLAFLSGGLVMLGIAGCYAELSCRFPRAGGEYVFAAETLGPAAGVLVGWFMLLFLVAIAAFEGIALSLLVQLLLPGLAGPRLWTLLGHDVHLGALLVGLAGIGTMAAINWRGLALSMRFQQVGTWGFIAASLLIILLGLLFGTPGNLQPPFGPEPSSASVLAGIGWVFGLSAMFLTGFAAAIHAVEDRKESVHVHSVVRAMLLGLGAAICFYVALTLSVASVAPWPETARLPIPAADAFLQLPAGGVVRAFILTAAILSLLKTWNAVLLIVGRLAVAQAQGGLLPAWFGELHPRFLSPHRVVAVVSLISALVLLAGRGAILPIVNMCALSVALIFVVMVRALWVARGVQHGPAPAFRLPGGRSMLVLIGLGSAAQCIILLLAPWQGAVGVPLEISLLALWTLLGLLAARRHAARLSRSPA
ncbi:MAG: APC family permease [Thermaurantiacus sp.]